MDALLRLRDGEWPAQGHLSIVNKPELDPGRASFWTTMALGLMQPEVGR